MVKSLVKQKEEKEKKYFSVYIHASKARFKLIPILRNINIFDKNSTFCEFAN